jgi:hypothetical protein
VRRKGLGSEEKRDWGVRRGKWRGEMKEIGEKKKGK